MPKSSPALDRFAQIGDLATSVRQLLGRSLLPLTGTCLVASCYLFFTGSPGANAFALITVGALLVLGVWRGQGVGLPILPLLAIQTLVAYGLPIINGNEVALAAPESEITHAGWEVLIYCGGLAGGWIFGLRAFSLSSPLCYALQGFDEERMGRLSRLGFRLMFVASGYEVLQSLQLLDFILGMLPTGSSSIINALLSAVNACGFFLAAMLLGKGGMASSQRLLFWTLLFVHCFISASSFLLSSTITIVFSVLIGLFWGGGRVPWRYIVVVLGIISFLNLGKFTMRERYWRTDTGGDGIPQFALMEMPATYTEWFAASLDTLSPEEGPRSRFASDSEKKKKSQSLGERINNLQNLLFVIDAMDRMKLEPLGGATYAIIPPLLVPRIIWPDKPRTHEGQVMLNVHFGRQDMNSTLRTYIAWGLLPEAYGNFGPVAGALIIGGALGFFFAWVEAYTARKILLSMEGFLSFTLFLGMANSFEMVASVLVTSIFQAFIPVILASKPFTEQVIPVRSEPA